MKEPPLRGRSGGAEASGSGSAASVGFRQDALEAGQRWDAVCLPCVGESRTV